MVFEDRFHAGHLLAKKLAQYKNNKDVVIIAIPRGALEIGYVLAKELHAPLDVAFIKKISAPGQPEFAIGAVSMDAMVIAPEYAHIPGIQEYAQQQAAQIRDLLQERSMLYHREVKPQSLQDKTVIVVDDGVATGRTLLLTLDLIKEQKPQKIIVALPVGPKHTIDAIKQKADEVICVHVPEQFLSVGQFYKNFAQVQDYVAIDLLKRANAS
ncbi:MAG: phosphoribosyltransferase [Candidatus Babeliales bacterium]